MIVPILATGVCKRAKNVVKEAHHETASRIELGALGRRRSDAQPRRRPKSQRQQRASG
jgi:hypothetical protein